MVSDWSLVILSDVLETIIDYRGKTPPKSETGIPVLTAASVKNGNVLKDKVSFVSEETYEKVTTRGFPLAGDVLITTEAPFGEVAPFPTDQAYHITRRIMALRGNPQLIDSSFLLYTLLGRDCQQQLAARTRGTTVPRVLKTDITGLKFKLPSLQEQQIIGKFLSCIDDKIQLNRQINQTLEQLAQTQFKSWFVDFDPVIDKALEVGGEIPPALEERTEQRRGLGIALKSQPTEIRKLFPGSFEYFEGVGWIPKGWRVGSCSRTAPI